MLIWTSWMAETVKNLPAMQETQVQSLGCEIPWRREWLRLQYSCLEKCLSPLYSPAALHHLTRPLIICYSFALKSSKGT